MINKKIANIVFYTFKENDRIIKQTCIFYEDGSVKNVSYDRGLDIAEILIQQENISSAEILKEMLNKRKIYVLTGKQLETRFNEFVVKKHKVQKENNNIFSNSNHKISSSKASQSTKDKKTKPNSKTNKYQKPEKKKGFFARVVDKIKSTKLVKRVALCATALAVGLGFNSCSTKNTKEGQMTNSNISAVSTDNNKTNVNDIYANVHVNSAYDNHTYNALLKTTSNISQKRAMQRVGENLDAFNGTFAEKIASDKTSVKAALSWEEMIALNIAYNDYEKYFIEAMFNGSEVDATELSNAYKTATLQLTGAYVIGTRENQVNSYKMIESAEGQDFVRKYENMLLDCKEATSESEKIKKINTFYKELYKDFPIDSKIREEGLSHADSRNTLESYKLAVTPIVAASEMMFQNLDIDHTLSDKAIKYFNGLGLCNIADAKFEKAMTISLNADTNELIPTYQQFKNAKIKELTKSNRYVIDDSQRDLSKLDEFKKIVNVHFNVLDSGFTGNVSNNVVTSSSTSYNTKTTKSKTSDRNEAVNKTSEVEVSDAEKKVDSSIDLENADAKNTADKEAESIRQNEQSKADKEAENIEKEIIQNEENLQDKIGEANNKINNNNSDNNKNNDVIINESDFGDHNVDFDNVYSDGSGKLNDSIKDITTDSSNDKTNEPLPDPNQTGAIFDSQSIGYAMTNEKIVDAYIASLEEQPSNEASPSYVYTK